MNDQIAIQQRKNRKWGRSIGKWIIILLLGFLITILAGGYWLLATPQGFQRLLTTVEQLSDGVIQVKGVSGTAQSLQINKLDFQREDLRLIVHRLKLDWQPAALSSKVLHIHEIFAQKIDVYTVKKEEEASTEPMALPDSLALPFALFIQDLKIDEVAIYSSDRINIDDDLKPTNVVKNIALQLESNAQTHQIKHLAVDSEYGDVKALGDIGTARPFKLNAQLKFESTQWGVTKAALTGDLEQLAIDLDHRHQSSQGTIQAQLNPFAEKQMVAALQIAMDQLNIEDYAKDTMQTNLSLKAKLNKNEAEQLIGDLRLNNHAVNTLDKKGLPFTSINTNIQLSEEAIRLPDFRLNLPQKGLISGLLAWQLNQSEGSATLKISQLDPTLIDKRAQAMKINGQVNAKGGLQDQSIAMQLTGDQLKLDTNINKTGNLVALEKLILQHKQSSLSGKGKINLENEQAVEFTGQLEKFNLAEFAKIPASSLSSHIALNGRLSPSPSGTLKYQFKDSHLNKQPVKGDGTVSFQQPDRIDSDARLQLGSNSLLAKGRFGRPGDVLKLNISAPKIAQIGFGLAGELQTKLQLKGTLKAPELDFDINGGQLVLPGEQFVQSLNTSGTYKKEVLSLALTLKDYQKAKKTQLQKLELNVAGKQSKHTIQTTAWVNDDLKAALRAHGGLQQKTASGKPVWDGQLNQLSVSGEVPVRLEAPARLLLSEEKISLGKTQLTVAGGGVDIAQANWTPKNWDTQGRFNSIGLHVGQEGVTKADVLHLGGQWSLSSKNLLSGNINIAREKGDWYLPGESPVPVGLQNFSLNVQAVNRELTGQFSLLGEMIGKASARVTLPLLEADGAMPVSSKSPINGDVALDIADLAVANKFVGDMLQVGGALAVNTKVSGTLDAPLLKGDIKGSDLVIRLIDQGLDLKKGELSAVLDQSTLQINHLKFVSPFMPAPEDILLDQVVLEKTPGALTMTGKIDFTEQTHQIKTTLDRISLLSPNQYWLVASGNLGMSMKQGTLALDGKLKADAGLITQPPAGQPKLADDIVFVSDKPKEKSSSQLANLNILLDLGEQFFIRASGLEGQLDGQLKLTSSKEQPLKATGSIAARDAAFKAYGQDLKVVRGMVNFYGALDDPGLNVLAVREGLDVEAGVSVTGTVRRPQVDLVSTPEVPDMAKLSWIVLGRAPDSEGVDTSLMIAAASSIFGGESGFTGQIRDALGVDELSFKQGDSSGGSPLASQVGVIGKRLSTNLYLSYERGITSTTAGVAKLTYNWTPNISIVTQAGDDSAGDIFYTFKFD